MFLDVNDSASWIRDTSIRERLNDRNLYNFVYHERYTLLHGATKYRCRRYVRKLVFYGFGILNKPDLKDAESSWDVSIRYPSKINDYFYCVLV